MRHLLAGSTLSAMLSYGTLQWVPTFFVRTHHLSQQRVGLLLSGLFGILGILGTLASGYLFDRLMRLKPAYAIWMVAVCQVVAVPLSAMAFLAAHLPSALVLFAVPVFIANFYLGPSLALVQSLAPLNMRTVAAALKMLLLNLVGLGLGPLLVGGASDLLKPHFGDASLQIALALSSLLSLWSAVHFWLCGRGLAQGLTAALQYEENCRQI
jgi:sugar phosphate permease